ncbi:peptide chain release factor N(5)-glutamine methyltransferase [Nitrogeniibacter aestuarii]|uniref:peptide chain release factor N(5)-glutamine methyltransferase n=1 Tax=Nitrogeniibacter aestuarii TaxID=2815343 RepID=UPI001E3A01D5|nr:peptide chain release factor N(5)-glutamine methyltransferase [Nitrogeniibacter aestuarii]
MSGLTVGAALRQAGALIGRVDARVLMCHVLACGTSYLIAHDDAPLDAKQTAAFDALVQGRCQGRPVAYLVGHREFYGREFLVNESVLIPRPETELIVDLARQLYPEGAARVLDLGTGSGALAVTLSREWPEADVVGVDASVPALDVAKVNSQRLGAQVRFCESDWFSALSDEPLFDLIVSNPPYIRESDPHLAAGDVRFEPASALVGGRDGLADIARICADAPAHLQAGGWLLFEHGYDQAGDVRSLLATGPFRDIQSWRDIARIERVTGGRLDAARAQA